MNSAEDFVVLIRDEIGLPVTRADLELGFDQVPGWDSLHMLRLVTVLERETGRTISFPDVLQAQSLGSLYRLAVPA
ncbi:acyl carrier protein [Kitasatospora sp. GAS204B]|uniref:acyl carrier protein n=1 Tax=unclassified Kitasatospora TaxID=2633591 RepID=UPI002476C063|nr:acyl carrier protein [Kitasatospora sp. GAS204B]MDH6118813.1 acyl carrier protein [Kitasatospora sp. GAS204B]